jgi:hypothetical protein
MTSSTPTFVKPVTWTEPAALANRGFGLADPPPQGFEHSPITSGAHLEASGLAPEFAPTHVFVLYNPSSAGQEGFEHSPITSTNHADDVDHFPGFESVMTRTPSRLAAAAARSGVVGRGLRVGLCWRPGCSAAILNPSLGKDSR